MIAEFGWPSAGYNMLKANPGHIEQAKVMRDFVARAEALGIEYNIIEAIDQPWKTNEGGVGPYWGLLDASRNVKFCLDRADHHQTTGSSPRLPLLLGLLLSLPLLKRAATPPSGRRRYLAITANIVGAWFAIVFAFWNRRIISSPAPPSRLVSVSCSWCRWSLIALARIEEIAAIAFGKATASPDHLPPAR